MEYKEYEKLNFDSLYETKGYPNKVWPLLNEYFSRYKGEYELSKDEIDSKVSKVLSNLDTIKIDGSITDSWAGCFVPDKKEIKINMESIKRSHLPQEQVLNTIFHELNHAGEDMGKDTTTSFQQYHASHGYFEGVALNEIITEMKSSRLACNDRTELLNKVKEGQGSQTLQLTGYGDLIFMGTMLHTALGIGEKEFLTLADKGKEEFDKRMRGKFPLGDDTYNNFISSITYYSDTLHSIKYNKKGPHTEQDKENMVMCINGIKDQCLYAMGKRMSYEAFKNMYTQNMEEFTTKSRYELEKMELNYKNGLSYILPGQEISGDSAYEEDVKRRILAYETLGKHEHELTLEQRGELLYSASENQDMTQVMQEQYGILTERGVSDFDKTMDIEYEVNLLKEEYGEKPWDNTQIMINVNKFSKVNVLKEFGKAYVDSWKSFVQDIKNIIDKYKQSKTDFKKLPPGVSDIMPEVSSDSTQKNGILQDLNGMIKSDEEIYISAQQEQEQPQKEERQKDDNEDLSI